VKSSGAREKLRDYDSLFGSQDVVIYDPEQENVQEIPITELHSFQNHPFKVIDDAAMESMVESMRPVSRGSPAIARQLDSGGYEIVAGHRQLQKSRLVIEESRPSKLILHI
jgi:ParB family chromosome partitioning protein